jgi:hypothetical protein
MEDATLAFKWSITYRVIDYEYSSAFKQTGCPFSSAAGPIVSVA